MNIRNKQGDTALTTASRLGNENITTLILNAKMAKFGAKQRRLESGSQEEDVKEAVQNAKDDKIKKLIKDRYLHLFDSVDETL